MCGSIIVIREKIEGWLKFRNWTQKQLAEEINYDEGNLSKIIKGELEPSKKILKRLMFVTGLGVALIEYDSTADLKEL